ncbi:MAG: methylmalonyl-CoA mutase family protein [Variibacter sp.]
MTDTETEPLPLASEFPMATRDAWLKLVETTLKGAPVERLRSKTYDGLPIEPLYPSDKQAQTVAGRPPVTPWQMLQRVDHPDPKAANGEALHDLENGATGLLLAFADAPDANGFGLAATETALAQALDGVYLDAGVALEFDAGASAAQIAQHLVAVLRKRDIAPNATNIRFGFDPLGAFATGAAAVDWSSEAPKFAAAISALASAGFKGPFAAADARAVHAAGGSEVQELAFALAAAVAYLRALEAGGIALDEARRMLFFRLAIDTDQFLGIAKLRALRKLWARVEEACGLTPAPVSVSAETAWRMMTRRDPWVNMLRATIASFAAGVGGADAITVLPFTAALGLPDRFARRVARNTQLILLEESNLAKVTDPAAGSGGIEKLTDGLCHAAWALFQDIERGGGAFAALATGLIQGKVAETRAARERAIARRKDALTGATEFPDIHELPVSVFDVEPQPKARATGSIREPLPRIRLAAPFERLRDASDAAQAKGGARPNIFLANLGRPADFIPRATYAKNFFETGGIEAVTNEGFAASSPPPERERSASEASRVGVDKDDPSPDRLRRSDPPLAGEGKEKTTDLSALTAAFKQSGAKLACLCSSDEVYATDAVTAAKALKAAGAAHLYLAGRPGDLEEALKAAGVGTFIYVGCDTLATLAAAHDILGIGH